MDGWHPTHQFTLDAALASVELAIRDPILGAQRESSPNGSYDGPGFLVGLVVTLRGHGHAPTINHANEKTLRPLAAFFVFGDIVSLENLQQVAIL